MHNTKLPRFAAPLAMTTATRTSHQIIFGDARNMRQIANRAARLVVTSPPYWQLEDYGGKAQIGFHDFHAPITNEQNV